MSHSSIQNQLQSTRITLEQWNREADYILATAELACRQNQSAQTQAAIRGAKNFRSWGPNATARFVTKACSGNERLALRLLCIARQCEALNRHGE